MNVAIPPPSAYGLALECGCLRLGRCRGKGGLPNTVNLKSHVERNSFNSELSTGADTPIYVTYR